MSLKKPTPSLPKVLCHQKWRVTSKGAGPKGLRCQDRQTRCQADQQFRSNECAFRRAMHPAPPRTDRQFKLCPIVAPSLIAGYTTSFKVGVLQTVVRSSKF